jgi:hypothetical protein
VAIQDEQDLYAMVEQVKASDRPEPAIVDKILAMLGLGFYAEVRGALTRPSKQERLGAMRILEKIIPRLLSADRADIRAAKKEIEDDFYDVGMLWEEG